MGLSKRERERTFEKIVCYMQIILTFLHVNDMKETSCISENKAVAPG